MQNPKSRYDFLAIYCFILPFVAKNKELNFVKTFFTKKYKFRGKVIPLRLSYVTSKGAENGIIRYGKGGSATITIKLRNDDFANFYVTVSHDNKILHADLERMISKLKRISAHEITHFIQNKFKGTTKHTDSLFLLQKKSNLKDFEFAVYFFQENELEAFVNEAYKLYKEHGKFFSNKEVNLKKKDFFTCLLFQLLEKFSLNGDLAFTKKMSFWDVLAELDKIEKYDFLFMMLWTIYYFVPEQSKFKHILHLPNDAPRVNKDLLEQNRKNLIEFLDRFTPYGMNVLNKLFSKIDKKEAFRKIFSVSESNENILNEILETVKNNG